MTTSMSRRGDLLAGAFSVLAIGGLALWFGGANMPDNTMSAAELEDRLNSRGLALAGAVLLIAAMVALLAFARWLRSRYAGNQLVALGATTLALGGLTHLVENVLVVVLYSGDISDGDAVADVTGALSNTAFGVIGLGVGVAAMGLNPSWLKVWGVITSLLGVAAALSYFAASLSFLAGPFNISLMAWLITVGVRGARPYSPGP